jgi:hypothetical protein
VQVYIDSNHSGSFTAGERTAFTDSSGNFSFGNVYPQEYSIGLVSPPAGWRPVFDYGFANPKQGQNANVNLLLTDYAKVSGAARVNGQPIDINYQTVWADLNHNGVFDSDEPYSTNNGIYTLELPAGSYQLRITESPFNYAGPNPPYIALNLAAGQVLDEVDFLFISAV